MLKPGDRVLVAVSGGIDSVVLLHILKKQHKEHELALGVAHFDHAIRPDSAQDAEFVKELAQSLKLKCYTERTDVPAYAKANKISLEVAARQLRYRFLEATAKANKFHKIALGHTLNDQAETLLMRLLRGSGLEGLSGIPPVRPAGASRRLYIRPLIECTREHIEAFAKTKKLQWREDPTNKDTTILRNRIRHELLPALTRDYNPNLLKTLGRTAHLLSQAVAHLQGEAERAWPSVTLDVQPHKVTLDAKGLLALPPFLQSLTLRRAMELVRLVRDLREIESAHLDAIHGWLSRGGPGELQLPAGLRLLRRHHRLIVTTQTAAAPTRYEYPLTLPGETVIPEIGWQFSTALTPAAPPLSRGSSTGEGTRVRAFIDADKVQGALAVRNRRPGDRIRLKTGTKKLQDFFVDRKISREARDTIPLICDADALIWIVGGLVNEEYRVTPQTRQVLRIIAERCKGAV
jgi:tRNA(Ile)-lysidine synthase